MADSRKRHGKLNEQNGLHDSASQIGKHMARARDLAGMSQEEAAVAIGVHEQTLSKYERGAIAKIPTAVLERAAVAYRRRPDELLSGQFTETSESADQPRLPFAVVMRTPAVRARLAALRAELIELGADEDREERIMTRLRDRQRLNDFVGGRTEDLYMEREALQLIDNYARIARDVLETLG